MNFFLILIPQPLNSQFLNLAPYRHYDEDGVQKSDLVLRSNNEVCNLTITCIFGILCRAYHTIFIVFFGLTCFEEWRKLGTFR